MSHSNPSQFPLPPSVVGHGELETAGVQGSSSQHRPPPSQHSLPSDRALNRRRAMEEELATFRSRMAVQVKQEEDAFLRLLEKRFALDTAQSEADHALDDAANLPADQAEDQVTRRRVESLKESAQALERVLASKGASSKIPSSPSTSSPPIAKISSKLKIVPPKEWDGDFDFVKRETWIRAARGYLNGVGLGDLDVFDECSDSLPIHTVRMLFSNKETNGLSPQAWFNARHERSPFLNLSQVFEAIREYWTDDHAADVAYDKYRSTRQGSLRGREFGALVEVLANGCFDRTIDENDRISTFERGLNSSYRDFLKTQVSLLTQLGRTPKTFREFVSIAAVADGLSQFSSSFKKSSSSSVSSSLSPSSSSGVHKKPDRSSSAPSKQSSRSTAPGGGSFDTAAKWVSSAIEWQKQFPVATQSDWAFVGSKPAPSHIRCFNCGTRGDHFSKGCPNDRKDPKTITLAAVKLSPLPALSPGSRDFEEETASSQSGNVNGE
ncbi:hypothetical protein JCM16303_002066 [Sporobolomyces ruberrimus]